MPSTAVEAAVILDALHAATGDTRCRVAAGILRGRRISGRRLTEGDDAALREIASLLDEGNFASVNAAAAEVALTRPGNSREATRRRLVRKFLQQRPDETT
jgi:hypothetical protein